MKNLSSFIDITSVINENANESSPFGKKIDKILKGNPSKLAQLIQKRQENWDNNKFDWSREPMFLIADADNEMLNNGGSRNFGWSRWKFIEGHKDDIHGTFKNYNVSDETGTKPNSVIGVFYDRHFEFITSIDVFRKLYDLFAEEYENNK